MKSLQIILLISFGLCMFTGCPDYSHQRSVPDYKNMKVDEAPADRNERQGKDYDGE